MKNHWWSNKRTLEFYYDKREKKNLWHDLTNRLRNVKLVNSETSWKLIFPARWLLPKLSFSRWENLLNTTKFIAWIQLNSLHVKIMSFQDIIWGDEKISTLHHRKPHLWLLNIHKSWHTVSYLLIFVFL